jgi:hypothetical protein
MNKIAPEVIWIQLGFAFWLVIVGMEAEGADQVSHQLPNPVLVEVRER